MPHDLFEPDQLGLAADSDTKGSGMTYSWNTYTFSTTHLTKKDNADTMIAGDNLIFLLAMYKGEHLEPGGNFKITMTVPETSEGYFPVPPYYNKPANWNGTWKPVVNGVGTGSPVQWPEENFILGVKTGSKTVTCKFSLSIQCKGTSVDGKPVDITYDLPDPKMIVTTNSGGPCGDDDLPGSR